MPDRRDVDSISDIKRTRLSTYEGNSRRISQDAKMEESDRAEYTDRFVYELLQNAVDEIDNSEEKRIHFELADRVFRTANTGSEFDINNLDALSLITDTTKGLLDGDDSTIGHKGRGFLSVLGITDNPQVYSIAGIDAQYNDSKVEDLLQKRVPDADPVQRGQIPTMTIPFEADRSAAVDRLIEEGYQTVFQFPLLDDLPKARIVNALREKLDYETLACLPNLKEVTVETEADSFAYTICREPWEGEADAQIITVVKYGSQDTSQEPVGQRQYVFFERNELCPPEDPVGISDQLLEDIGTLRVSIGFRFFENTDEMVLGPITTTGQAYSEEGENSLRFPPIHVALPTEDISPIPALINGQFQVANARQRLNIPDRAVDENVKSVNTFLIEQLTDLIGAEVTRFVDETDTSIQMLLGCLDCRGSENTSGDDNDATSTERIATVFVTELRKELRDTPIIPRLEQTAAGESVSDREWVSPMEIVVPFTHEQRQVDDSNPELGQLVAMLHGPDRVEAADIEDSGWFPRRTLLDFDSTQILVALGAKQLDPAATPRLLGSIPDKRAVLQYTDTEDKVTVDPILHALGLTWLGFSDPNQRRNFKQACQENAVFPVGSQQTTSDGGRYYSHITKNDDQELFLPPERSVPSEKLDNVALFPFTLYYGTATASEPDPREAYLNGELEGLLGTIWDPNDFAFNDIYNKAIAPKLPGPRTPNPDNIIPDEEATIATLLFELAKGGTRTVYDASSPLPYESRSEEEYFKLSLLPLPIKGEDEWARAHEIYFGSEWQPEHATEYRIQELFEAAEVDQAAFLAPPETFGIDRSDQNSRREAKRFFRWFGVAEHIRPAPFFHPKAEQAFQQTKGLSPASDTVIDVGNETRFSSLGADSLNPAEWEEYRNLIYDRLEDRSEGGEDYYIRGINSLEYFDGLMRAAKTDSATANKLLGHIANWWDQLSAFADATLVLWTNKTFSISQRSNDTFYENEREAIGPNLWLWQLRREPWLETAHGRIPPEESWLLSEDETMTTFSISADDAYQLLLPIIIDKDIQDLFIDLPDLINRLDVREVLTQESITPADARAVTEAIVKLFDDGEPLDTETVSEIRSVYSQLIETLPGLTQGGEIDDEDWDPDVTGLGNIKLLCKVDNGFQFVQAANAYFVREPGEAEQYAALDVPIFIVRRSDTPRLAAYFAVNDLNQMISTEPNPGNDRQTMTADFCEDILSEVSPYLLCRLLATRRGSKQEDAARLSRFVDDLMFVESLEVKHRLEGDPNTNEIQNTREVFITEDDDGNKDTVFVVAEGEELMNQKHLQRVARALKRYLEYPDWESLYVLLQQGPDRHALVNHLKMTGAPYQDEVISKRKRALQHDGERNPVPEEYNTGVDRTPDESTEKTLDNDQTGRLDPGSGRTITSRGIDRDGPDVPSPDQLRGVGSREQVDPTSASDGPQDTTGTKGGTGGGNGGIHRHGGNVTGDYINKIDKFGMVTTMQAERDRLANAGCEDPDEYVWDIHTERLYNEAKSNEKPRQVLNQLEDKGVIGSPYPGFDILVISREDETLPERCIELKSSISKTRTPSITWNEWKSASTPELQDRYYLYVARELKTGKSGDATLLQIQNPFKTLNSRTRTRRTEEREVQVRLDQFDPDEGTITRQSIFWEGKNNH